MIESEGLISATEEEILGQEISVYPSASIHDITLDTDLTIQQIDVFNSTGQQMESIKTPSFPYQLNVSEYGSGVHYLYMRTSDHQYATSKFVKL